MRDIKLIVIHHSASPLTTTAQQIAVWHAARFRLGIGYHRIIEAAGAVLDGRKVQRVGAHAKGSNMESVGICVVGDNTQANCHWTPRQNDALAKTIMYYHTLYPLAQVCGHRDTMGASTLCPGLNVAAWCRNRLIDVPLLEVS
jgi:hypothetical protein